VSSRNTEYLWGHRVDVDLPSLPASTVEHGRCHQQDVRVSVVVYVHRQQLTAEIRADLETDKTKSPREKVVPKSVSSMSLLKGFSGSDVYRLKINGIDLIVQFDLVSLGTNPPPANSSDLLGYFKVPPVF